MTGLAKFIFCHGSKHSRGVAILYNPKLKIAIQNQSQSEDVTFLVLQILVEDWKIICVNIYASNDPSSQIKFFKELNNLLQQFSGEGILVGGDLNCPLYKDDKEGGRDFSFKGKVAEEIKLMMFNLDLEDVWRKLNPSSKNKMQIRLLVGIQTLSTRITRA